MAYVTAFLTGATQRLRQVGLPVAYVIRALALGSSFISAFLAAGAVVIASSNGPDNVLGLSRVYPVTFGASAAVWMVVAFRPTFRWCSVGASLLAAPALTRVIDFVFDWITDGTDFPGSRMMGIGAWSLVFMYALITALLVAFLSYQESPERARV